jgi:hypothetical protein
LTSSPHSIECLFHCRSKTGVRRGHVGDNELDTFSVQTFRARQADSAISLFGL